MPKIGETNKVTMRVAPSLRGLLIPIDSVSLDPANARLHGIKNMDAIKASLAKYGQKKPIVVRQQTMHIVAGNGTWAAAKQLGWTEIAASVEPMTEAEAAGYGLADNRTAELAEWDFEVVKKLERFLSDQGEE